MQIQCPKCTAWTDADLGVCELCGASFNANDTSLKRKDDSAPSGYNGNGVVLNDRQKADATRAMVAIIICVIVLMIIAMTVIILL